MVLVGLDLVAPGNLDLVASGISMLHAGTNVLFHVEGGHYATHLEPPVKFEALNYQVAASVALQEGQNGLGMPLVNVDGSLCDHASFSCQVIVRVSLLLVPRSAASY